MSHDQTEQVPTELQALFDAEKERPPPESGDREAVYTAVAASCGFAAVAAGVSTIGGAAAAGAGGTTVGASTGAAVASTASSSLPAMLIKPVTLLVFAAGAATGTGTTLLVDHMASEPQPAEVRVVYRDAPTVPPAAPAVALAPKAPPVAALHPTCHTRTCTCTSTCTCTCTCHMLGAEVYAVRPCSSKRAEKGGWSV